MLVGCERSWSPKSISEESLLPPILLQNLAMHEDPLTLQSDLYNLFESFGMSNVEAYSPIAHRSAFTSVCKAAFCLFKFCIPKSWIFPKLSNQTYLHPLNWVVEVHELFIIQILSKLKTRCSSIRCSCGDGGIVSFALNRTWHSFSTYQTSSKGFMSIP